MLKARKTHSRGLGVIISIPIIGPEKNQDRGHPAESDICHYPHGVTTKQHRRSKLKINIESGYFEAPERMDETMRNSISHHFNELGRNIRHSLISRSEASR
jgi:hypothetical protein